MKTLSVTILLLILTHKSLQLTAQQVTNICHCDLTTSYCDFGCCCDTDCSTTFSADCFLGKSSLFCLNTSYYYKVDSTLTANAALPNCYYYNQTTTQQEEVTISARELADTARKFVRVAPLANDQALVMDRGYVLGDQFPANTLFYFTNTDGSCLAAGTNAMAYRLSWRVNSDFTCTGTSNSINLYTSLFGRTIPTFSSSPDQMTTIPSPDTSNYNEAIIYILIGTFGSSKIEYIQSIRTVGRISGSTGTRTLRVRFVNPVVDIDQEEEQPSFFPQIPKDIFYPLYQIAYSF